MSNSRIIPRGRARGLPAWRPGDVAQPPPAAATPGAPPPDPAALQRAEIERQRAAARQEGYAAGLAEGRAAGSREVAELRALLANLGELMGDVEQGMAADVLALALEVSRQMVRQALRVKPEAVLTIIREAALSVPGLAPGARLLLNPADAHLVREALADRPEGAEFPWQIVEDNQLERGGCRFVSGASHGDATVQSRWRRVVAALGRDDAWLEGDA